MQNLGCCKSVPEPQTPKHGGQSLLDMQVVFPHDRIQARRGGAETQNQPAPWPWKDLLTWGGEGRKALS